MSVFIHSYTCIFMVRVKYYITVWVMSGSVEHMWVNRTLCGSIEHNYVGQRNICGSIEHNVDQKNIILCGSIQWSL